MSDTLQATSSDQNNSVPTHLIGNSNAIEDMSKVGIYLRVSTKRQTIAQQEQELHTLANIYRLDLSKAKRYEEHGKSANKPKYYSIKSRPAGKELWKDIHSGLIDKVVILDLDRCWRHGVTGVQEAEYLTNMGIQICTVLGGAIPVDLTTSAGFSAFWNEMGKAQAECMKTSERVKRKQKFNLSVGKANTGKAYGWNKDEDGFIIPNFEELAVLAYFKKETEGRWGRKPSEIAAKFNAEGVPTATGLVGPFPRKTQGWKAQTLERALSKSQTHLHHAKSLKKRYVEHPILGRIKIGYEEVVRAESIAKAVQDANSFKSDGLWT